MQKNSTVCCQHRGSIAILTLNLPEKNNALDGATVDLLTQHLRELEHNETVRVILLTAEGEHFCAGADLKWMETMATGSASTNQQDAEALAQLFCRLATSPKATIAVVHGAVMGGGCGLAACADIVIASEDARFCFSEVKLGLIPATIAPYVVRRIGFHAQRYFITADTLTASTALSLGLVDEVISRGECRARAETVAQKICHHGPQAIEHVKQLLQHLLPVPETQSLHTAHLLASIRQSAEAREGIRAFLEKRKPHWSKES